MRWLRLYIIVILITTWTVCCDKEENSSSDILSICQTTEYPNWATSEYVLPYPVGTSFIAVQGNCTKKNDHWHWNSHNVDSPWAFAYDFLMPIGTIVTASRGGEVVWLRENNMDSDNSLGQENAIIIKHEDNTFSAYSHLTHEGVVVELGSEVSQGDTIAISGNSGLSSIAHLHFQISPCLEPETCGSLPVTFKNTIPNPQGLIMGEEYPAMEY